MTDYWIELAIAFATPVAIVLLAIVWRRGIATKDDVSECERRVNTKIEDVRKDLSGQIGEVRKELSAIREILAYMQGQRAPVLPFRRERQDDDEKERDEA